MKALRLSFLLHALLLIVALTLPMGGEGDGNEKGKAGRGNSDAFDVTIVDPPAKEEAVVVEDEGLTALKKLAPHASDTCEKFYGGIGIMDSMGGVVEVYPGYPAANAGIIVGDEIVGSEPIRGEVGTPVDVVVIRRMRRLTFHLVRDKICIA